MKLQRVLVSLDEQRKRAITIIDRLRVRQRIKAQSPGHEGRTLSKGSELMSALPDWKVKNDEVEGGTGEKNNRRIEETAWFISPLESHK